MLVLDAADRPWCLLESPTPSHTYIGFGFGVYELWVPLRWLLVEGLWYSLLTGCLSDLSMFLPSPQLHPWVTKSGEEPLPSEEEHCSVVEVTEEEVKNSVKLIPSWTTVVRG